MSGLDQETLWGLGAAGVLPAELTLLGPDALSPPVFGLLDAGENETLYKESLFDEIVASIFGRTDVWLPSSLTKVETGGPIVAKFGSELEDVVRMHPLQVTWTGDGAGEVSLILSAPAIGVEFDAIQVRTAANKEVDVTLSGFVSGAWTQFGSFKSAVYWGTDTIPVDGVDLSGLEKVKLEVSGVVGDWLKVLRVSLRIKNGTHVPTPVLKE